MKILNWLKKSFCYEKAGRYIKKTNLDILDIGGGNVGAVRAKLHFPDCNYALVDIQDKNDHGAKNLNKIDQYFKINLQESGLILPEKQKFDLIVLSHIVEHLDNGLEVLYSASSYLKPGGVIIVEYPRFATSKYPSKFFKINFWDDKTHVRFYNLMDILNVFNKSGLKVLDFGIRRFWRKIIFSPLYILVSIMRDKKFSGHHLWDITAFSEYAIAYSESKDN